MTAPAGVRGGSMRDMLTRALAATAAAVLVLAGCGGEGDADSVSSGQDVADLVGCTGFANDSEEMFVTEGGSCDLEGEDLGVYYFGDQDARDSYVETASGFGGVYLVGDGWAVEGPPAVLEDLQSDVGGELSADG